jgi:hypothetical protein
VIRKVREAYEPLEIIEFSLTYERRGQANNFVATAPGSGTSILVEARPVDAGPIEATMPIQLISGITTLDRLVPNPSLEPRPEVSVAQGWHVESTVPVEWRDNPRLAPFATYVLKTNLNVVPYALKVTFNDGAAIKVGPNNWFLQPVAGGALKELFIEEAKAGDKVVSGIERGEIKSITISAVERIEHPPGAYVLVELCNLRWAKIGPALVSVDHRPWDEATYGLATGTAITQVDVREGQTRVAEQSVPVQKAQMANPKILGYDPALALLVPATTGAVKPQRSTRTLEVVVNKGGKTRAVECGPSHVFLMQKGEAPAPTSEYVRAADLRPGDAVFLAEAGRTNPQPSLVKRVTPKFYPATELWVIEAEQRLTPAGDSATDADVAFGNELGVLMARPGKAKKGPVRARPLGEEGIGDASGQRNNTSTKGDNTFMESQNPTRPDLISRKTDKIQFPPDGLEILSRRGRDVWARFTAENVRTPTGEKAPLMQHFWQGVYAASGLKLPYATNATAVLGATLQEFLKARTLFLTNAEAHELNRITFSEIALASWLRDHGCTNTSDLLLLDLVELAVYAGCESGKERERLGNDLLLAAALHMPQFVGGEFKPEDLDLKKPLSTPAINWAKQWASQTGNHSEIFRDATRDVSLAGLYAYWAHAGSFTLPPMWQPLEPPDTKGQIPENSELAKRFQQWIRERAREIKPVMVETAK